MNLILVLGGLVRPPKREGGSGGGVRCGDVGMPATGWGGLLMGGGEGGRKAGVLGMVGEGAVVKGRGAEGRRRGWLERVQGGTVSLQISA